MKQLILILSIVFTANLSFAQPNEVVNAYNHLNSGELDKAKLSIDKAVNHEKTREMAKAWKYRGDIYYQISMSKNDEYKALSNKPLRIAFESYEEAVRLDKSNRYTSDIKRTLYIIQNFALNNGVAEFNESNYEKARTDFELTKDVSEYLGKTDSLAYYNAGLASERMGDTEAALGYYKHCIKIGYRAESMYSFVLFLYQKNGQTEEFRTTLEEGLTKFPNNIELISTQLNIFIREGKNEEALALLDNLIEQESGNKIYLFTKGTLLDRLGNFEEAEQIYLKAIRIDPNYFDANYNLGALYFNRGVEINNEANELDNNDEYQKKIEVANVQFRKSMKYLEEAHRINPENRETMNSLVQIYARLDETEKFNEMKAKL